MICLGQGKTIYRTLKKGDFHYVEVKSEIAIVYKMGMYLDKAGRSAAIVLNDTMYRASDNEYKGRYYSLYFSGEDVFLYKDANKKIVLIRETDTGRVNSELNSAYFLGSHIALSERLKREFPLYSYSFRNGFYLWKNLEEKNYDHDAFVRFTDARIRYTYDSISKEQSKYTNTANFIKQNANEADSDQLLDSLNTLPPEYCPVSCYFDQSVYNIVKAKPAAFYKILEDHPSDATIIYFAVKHDKDLVEQLRSVDGYENAKRDFSKNYKFGRSVGYRVAATYAVIAGLVTWLIVSQ